MPSGRVEGAASTLSLALALSLAPSLSLAPYLRPGGYAPSDGLLPSPCMPTHRAVAQGKLENFGDAYMKDVGDVGTGTPAWTWVEMSIPQLDAPRQGPSG